MSSSYSILDLSRLIKDANEYMALGRYGKALKKYEIILPIIEARIVELWRDTTLQEKWKSLLKNLKEDRDNLVEIVTSLNTFHNVYGKDGQIMKNPDEFPSTSVNVNYIPPNQNPENYPYPRPNQDQNNNYNPPQNVPPKNIDRPVVPPKPVPPPKPVLPPKPPVSGGKQPPKPTKPPKPPKKPYLEFLYPDGKGPDSELIAMLEREVVDTNPKVSFDDIAELEQAKHALQEAVLLPLAMPNFFKGIRRPWRGVLLYGPPGTGKTMLAKALATKGETTFFNVHSSSFASKWRGESEKLVRILFEMARYYAPTTIFIDEVDSLCSKRGGGNEGDGSRRVKAELLVQMEGVSSNTSAGANEQNKDKDQRQLVTVMGATNRPWDLDEALRRRFEKRIYIPLPNEKGRQQLFYLNTKKIDIAKNVDAGKLVSLTKGYSGADISNVCREAALMPLRRELLANKGKNLEDLVKSQDFRTRIRAPITMSDFEKAIENISKSVSEIDLQEYDKWTKEFSSV